MKDDIKVYASIDELGTNWVEDAPVSSMNWRGYSEMYERIKAKHVPDSWRITAIVKPKRSPRTYYNKNSTIWDEFRVGFAEVDKQLEIAEQNLIAETAQKRESIVSERIKTYSLKESSNVYIHEMSDKPMNEYAEAQLIEAKVIWKLVEQGVLTEVDLTIWQESPIRFSTKVRGNGFKGDDEHFYIPSTLQDFAKQEAERVQQEKEAERIEREKRRAEHNAQVAKFEDAFISELRVGKVPVYDTNRYGDADITPACIEAIKQYCEQVISPGEGVIQILEGWEDGTPIKKFYKFPNFEKRIIKYAKVEWRCDITGYARSHKRVETVKVTFSDGTSNTVRTKEVLVRIPFKSRQEAETYYYDTKEEFERSEYVKLEEVKSWMYKIDWKAKKANEKPLHQKIEEYNAKYNIQHSNI